MIFNNPLEEFLIWRSRFEVVIKDLNNGETFPNLTRFFQETNQTCLERDETFMSLIYIKNKSFKYFFIIKTLFLSVFYSTYFFMHQTSQKLVSTLFIHSTSIIIKFMVPIMI